MLAVLVHVAFFALLIFGVNWRAEEAPGMVVDIWSDLPENAPAPRPAPPPPQVETPKPEPVPVKKIEPKPTPPAPITKAEVPKADIALKEKKQKPEKPKPEPIKPQKQDLLKQGQLQQEQARQLEIIRQRLVSSLCGDGNPLLVFDIALLPTGQILGNPALRKSSGIPACDKAVENAILQSDPLPVPNQPETFAVFRNLQLNFKPNE